MPRIWKEANDGRKYSDAPSNPLPAPARNLVSREFVCVSVCSFAFRFESKDEIREHISFLFSLKRKLTPPAVFPTSLKELIHFFAGIHNAGMSDCRCTVKRKSRRKRF